MIRELRYSVLDVFAERPLEGNPLAVFHDARSLSTAEMQALARETNLAETAFLLPGDAVDERQNGVRVRIFTTQEELPFAGHPTLGTASWLHLNHPTLRGSASITLALKVGPIPVSFTPPAAGEPGVCATMRQNDPVFGATQDRAEVASLLGLEEGELLEGYAPQVVSTGLPFCIVPLRSVEAAQRMQLDHRRAAAWLTANGASFLYAVAPLRAAVGSGLASAHWHARMQFYGGEDPATGSAAGCCLSWLVAQGLVAPERPTVIEQGIEIQRPSRITAQASLQAGAVCNVRVSGRTIPVAEGSFFLS